MNAGLKWLLVDLKMEQAYVAIKNCQRWMMAVCLDLGSGCGNQDETNHHTREDSLGLFMLAKVHKSRHCAISSKINFEYNSELHIQWLTSILNMVLMEILKYVSFFGHACLR